MQVFINSNLSNTDKMAFKEFSVFFTPTVKNTSLLKSGIFINYNSHWLRVVRYVVILCLILVLVKIKKIAGLKHSSDDR